MSRLRLWHGMVIIAAAALLFAVMHLESPCTPLSPILMIEYVCVPLAIRGARQTGRCLTTGLFLGFFLGPIGAYLASTERQPEGWPDTRA